MAIVFNSDAGTITGLSVGGLPDGIVDAGTVAADVATQAEIDAKLNLAGGTITSALTVQNNVSSNTDPSLILSGSSNASQDHYIQMAANFTSNPLAMGMDNSSNTFKICRNSTGNITSGEHLVIDSSGNIGIGNATPGSYDAGARQLVIGDYNTDASTGMTISGSTNNIIYFADGTSGDAAYRGSITYNHASDYMNFRTGGFNERMRIDSSGNVGIGGTPGDKFDCFGPVAMFRRTASGSGYERVVAFKQTTTEVGNIKINNSSTQYATSSDYRLKENVVDMADATTRLKQLKPKRFNWIVDDTNTLVDGFLAHEVSSIVPEATSGEKDDMEDDGITIKPQGIDQSKLVPLLVKAMQEQQEVIESLTARITTLEG